LAAAAQRIRRRRRRLHLAVTVALLLTALGVGVVLISGNGSSDRIHSPGLPSFVVDPQGRALAPVFERWAGEYGVPVALLEGLAWRESRWDNLVRSDAGAIGIGQLLPETAAFVARELIGKALDPRKPRDNIRLTARYLRSLIDRFDGKTSTALAAYLQGSTSVVERGVTPQTAAYVHEVLALRDQFARARDS
jgi:hypothetical protein